MRIPHSWFTEVLHTRTPGWTVTPTELDAAFVRVGFEVEDLTILEKITGPLTVGRVVEIEELTDFKKPIRFCRIDVGAPELQEIVCGATNFAVGDLVVAALPGTVLPGGFAIAARETYGRISHGMLCSLTELGLSGAEQPGILVLSAGSGEPGELAVSALGLDDAIIELNVTPDRGYAFSVRGLSRELAGSFDLPVADIADFPASGTPEANDVAVEKDSGATRFVLRKVSGINPAAVTPWWMQRRLLMAGMRCISPAVDVTNYVMLELGHPLHAFDASKIKGQLLVRKAKDNEQLLTLDGATRNLHTEDTVIADDSGVISLAGVMGGASTEVSATTVDVLLEGAIWNSVAVFRTGKRQKLSSEAAKRYERGVDSAITALAVQRAGELLVEIAGGVLSDTYTDWGTVFQPPTVEVPENYASSVAGVDYPAGTTRRRLVQVGCEVTGDGDLLLVTPPTWRLDLKHKSDCAEEVLRLEGLEKIQPKVPLAPAGRGLTLAQKRRRSLGKALAADGLNEVLTSPFFSLTTFDSFGVADDDPRRVTAAVLNPLESDRPHLATTLLPSLLETVARNLARGQRDLGLFAIAQVVQPVAETVAVEPLPVDRRPTDEEIARLNKSLPVQPVHVAVALTGNRENAGPWGPGRGVEVTDILELVRVVAETYHTEISFVATQYPPFHPGRCAELQVGGVVVGHAGELHPEVAERLNLPPRLCVLEMNIAALPLVEKLPAPQISAFPAVLQDLSVIVDATVPAALVQDALQAGAGELLESIALYDVYQGSQTGDGKKSLTFSLRFRAADRTLTEDDASAGRDSAVAHAHNLVGAIIRGPGVTF